MNNILKEIFLNRNSAPVTFEKDTTVLVKVNLSLTRPLHQGDCCVFLKNIIHNNVYDCFLFFILLLDV